GENKILLIVASSSSFNLESLVYKKYLQLAHSFSSVLTTGTILMGDAFLLLRKLWGFLPVDNLAHNHRLDESVRPRAKEVAF
ncbi:hypothetical protein, partial [Lysinibacillus sphaericus]|uniref:hypothetical protein n=1 Tax=Lysinibacillus sphaericus TaxID=1421 RepID=UPI001CBA891F